MFYLLLLTLKEEMQNIVGERSDSNGLERTVGGLKVEVHTLFRGYLSKCLLLP